MPLAMFLSFPKFSTRTHCIWIGRTDAQLQIPFPRASNLFEGIQLHVIYTNSRSHSIRKLFNSPTLPALHRLEHRWVLACHVSRWTGTKRRMWWRNKGLSTAQRAQHPVCSDPPASPQTLTGEVSTPALFEQLYLCSSPYNVLPPTIIKWSVIWFWNINYPVDFLFCFVFIGFFNF